MATARWTDDRINEAEECKFTVGELRCVEVKRSCVDDRYPEPHELSMEPPVPMPTCE